MTVTPSDISTSEQEFAADAIADSAFADAELDLGIPEEVPSADDPSSRAAARPSPSPAASRRQWCSAWATTISVYSRLRRLIWRISTRKCRSV